MHIGPRTVLSLCLLIFFTFFSSLANLNIYISVMYFKYVKNNIQGTYFVGILTDDIDVASTMSAV